MTTLDSRRPSATSTFVARLLLIPVLACPLSVSLADDVEPATEAPITAEDREHWAFRPLARPELPAVKQGAWARNEVDRFILARLEERELAPALEADRVTLIRRLAFDLTGLPPTPEEVDAFVKDESENAYEKLVDRLLASPEYGRRWGQHWLDLARFAETDGFEHDLLRPNAWRYRDWVIDALNADMPYDRFVLLQLAGDEVAPDDPDSKIATGFLLCGPDMPDINLQEERRHNFLNDMAGTVGSAFLGLQFGCAQCHDHKYDPVSQLDFYRLRAFFENTDPFKQHPVGSAADLEKFEKAEQVRGRKIRASALAMKAIEAEALKRLRDAANDSQLQLDRKQLIARFNVDEKKRYDKTSKESDRLRKKKSPLPMGRVMREKTGKPASSYLWVRGEFRRRGAEVSPKFLRIVNDEGRAVPKTVPGVTTSGRRVALARWLTRPENPLTTRVIVNRLWQHHFGTGLVGTASDFGTVGDSPTHPALLDWLATELPRRKWSLKAMHRLIVGSATYRQQGRLVATGNIERDKQAAANWKKNIARDPENRFLGRMPRRRLEGEAIRDSMLAVSDRLSDRSGGLGVRPPLPQELLSTVHKGHWTVSPDERDHRRRSIYLFVRRNLRYPMFDVFDRPDTNASCPRRNQSTIAPQALTLLNSEFSLNAAKDLAEYLLTHAGDDTVEQVTLCYRRVLGRAPSAEERRVALQFLETSAAALRSAQRPASELALPDNLPADRDVHEAAALTGFCLAMFNLNEFVYVD